MQNTNVANTDRLEQLEVLGFSGEADYIEHQRVMNGMATLTQRQLQRHRAVPAPQIVHLSETGVHAGRRLCLAPRDGSNRSVHAMFAPFDDQTFRESICAECMKVWAMEAYEDEDLMPEYIATARAAAKLAAASTTADASPKADQ